MEDTKSVRISGYTDSSGEWRPKDPVSYAPVFVWPPKLKKFLIWLVNYLFTWNLFYLGIVLFSYAYLQPPIEEMKTLSFSWISTIIKKYGLGLAHLWWVAFIPLHFKEAWNHW